MTRLVLLLLVAQDPGMSHQTNSMTKLLCSKYLLRHVGPFWFICTKNKFLVHLKMFKDNFEYHVNIYLTVDSNRMTKFKDFRHTRTPVGFLRYKRHNTKSCQATHHLMVHVLNHQYESMTDQRCCRNGYSFSISILSNCQEQGLLFGTGTELVLQAILNPITLLQTQKSGNASLNLA